MVKLKQMDALKQRTSWQRFGHKEIEDVASKEPSKIKRKERIYRQ